MQAETTERDGKRTSRVAERMGRFEHALVSWEDRKPGRKGRGCYHAYNVLFPLFALIVLAWVPLSGRELIWNVDGLNQYYPFFVYEGQWIRSIVSGLFSGGGLQVPLWEWCSGYGADVATTFDVFLDPLNLVSAITPEAISEWVFQLLVVFRLYLAGLAFTHYCRVRGESRTGTVLGALLYALCGAGLTVVRWSSGLHALILFPLVLAGAERMLQGRRPWGYLAPLALLAITSYYFTFMACVLLVAYLAVRVVMTQRPNLTAARFMRWFAAFAGLTLLALALAGFAIVPAVSALANMGRVVEKSTVVPLLYSGDYYLGLLGGFLSTHDVGSDTYQGFGGLALLAIALLFARRGENRELKACVCVLGAFFLVPAVGSFFNGLNYATNRWAWAFALCVALVVARMAPALARPRTLDRRVLVATAAAYALLLLVPSFRTEANVAGFAALLAALAIVCAPRPEAAPRALLACALAICLGVNGLYFLAAEEGGIAGGQVPLGMAYAKLTSASADSVALEANDDGWWRYDAGLSAPGSGAPVARIRNNSLVLGLEAPDFYNSVYNDGVDAFHTELAVAGNDINFSYVSLQGRSDLMSLLGVRYYVQRADGTDPAPYGFDEAHPVAEKSVMGHPYRLLKSDSAMPLAFALDRAISRSDYLSLDAVRRQQALLQAVVLEDDASAAEGAGATRVSAADLAYEDQTHEVALESAQGATYEDGRVIAQVPGASVTLRFEGRPASDTYLCLKGLSYRALKPSELAGDTQGMSWYQRANLLAQDLAFKGSDAYALSATTDASAGTGYVTNYVPSDHMYGGKDTWLVSLGYADEAAHAVTITFSEAGEYDFDAISVQTETHEARADWVAAGQARALEGVSRSGSGLSGTIEVDQPSTLLFSVAYSTGWTAVVDGNPVEVRRADTGFMAIDLTKGHHSVELRYATPGLAEGLAVSGVAILATAALAVALGRPRKRS